MNDPNTPTPEPTRLPSLTLRHLLGVLQGYDREAPKLLDKPVTATFGNDESGNAESFDVVNLVFADNLTVNGLPQSEEFPSPLVFLMEENEAEPTPTSGSAYDSIIRKAAEAGWSKDSMIILLCRYIDQTPNSLDTFLQKQVEDEMDTGESEEDDYGE